MFAGKFETFKVRIVVFDRVELNFMTFTDGVTKRVALVYEINKINTKIVDENFNFILIYFQ